MKTLQEVKDALTTANAKADILVTAVEGIQKDVPALKLKIDQLKQAVIDAGIPVDPQLMQDVSDLVDGLGTKVSDAADQLQVLDDSTDADNV